jgi:hypothetical protein
VTGFRIRFTADSPGNSNPQSSKGFTSQCDVKSHSTDGQSREQREP